MRELYTMRFTALRLIRAWVVLLLLFVVPFVLVTLLSIIMGDAEEGGLLLRNEINVMMVLAFQLFGGSVAMNYIHQDFFTERRYRIQSLPMNTTLYGFTTMLIGTLYSIILGALLAGYTVLVWNVDWGNIAWSIFIIALMATLSSIVCLIFTFSVKKFNIAERLSEVYGVGAILIAGLIFPMPDHAVINWVNEYINPIMLAYEAIDAYRNANVGDAWMNAGLLGGLIVITFVIMLLLGRRRMP
ncbi:ABC transporter permease [Natribacillus halophilus]|uniref:ABC-2 type transport system permease protein n=1 Tax=Natribacillus halophilus TaxID=549003 RepID=A0A1G8S271_9BACI|nr:ABC transporter permease [Natribacillus halophilus]SDJ23338.1 ABC-2 type transport system permease protein [Natribacillus halophilus]